MVWMWNVGWTLMNLIWRSSAGGDIGHLVTLVGDRASLGPVPHRDKSSGFWTSCFQSVLFPFTLRCYNFSLFCTMFPVIDALSPYLPHYDGMYIPSTKKISPSSQAHLSSGMWSQHSHRVRNTVLILSIAGDPTYHCLYSIPSLVPVNTGSFPS